MNMQFQKDEEILAILTEEGGNKPTLDMNIFWSLKSTECTLISQTGQQQ